MSAPTKTECLLHAERLARMESQSAAQSEILERIEKKLDADLDRITSIEKDLHLARWLGGLATAIGLSCFGVWLSTLRK